jgi:NodT family efflux transporter outer membrane factor (OMF) lipoprotein
MKNFMFLIIIMALVSFSGCRGLEPEPVKPLDISPGAHFTLESGSTEKLETWWYFLSDTELDSLIQRALSGNFDLASLRARISCAQAVMEKQKSFLYPDLLLSFSGTEQAARTGHRFRSGSNLNITHSWDASVSGSYTADMAEAVSYSVKADRLNLDAALMDFNAGVMELSAGIAETWVDIITTRIIKQTIKAEISTARTLLDLQKLRFAKGKAKALDVSMQKQALAEAEAFLPLIEKQESLLFNELAFLSGISDPEKIRIKRNRLPELKKIQSVRIPVYLLSARADVRAAKMRLLSSKWDIAAAKAKLFPSFTLTTKFLFSSGRLDLLFRNWVGSLAAAVSGTVFDGGYKKSEIRRLKAAADENLSNYAGTMASAIREVEDNLVSIKKQDRYVFLLENQLKAAELTSRDAWVQYRNGQASYLSFLGARNAIDRLQQKLAQERANAVKYRIRLCRALGWKWKPLAGKMKRKQTSEPVRYRKNS